MTKANNLLKQAALYEKLALYGRRQDYLRALAQSGDMLPSEMQQEIKSAVTIINSVLDSTYSLDVYSKLPNKISPASDISTVEKTYSQISSVLLGVIRNPGANSSQQNMANKIYGALIGAQEHINAAKRWIAQQPEQHTPETTKRMGEPPDYTISPEGRLPKKSPSAAKTIYDNLNFFYASNNLKGMMSLLPQLEAEVKKLHGDNPYVDNQYTQLITKVKEKLGEA